MKATKKKPAGKKTRAKATTSKASAGDAQFASVMAKFEGDPLVTSGKMMSSLGLKVNGKIFAMFYKGQLVVKLPKERVDALISQGAGKRFDPRGDGRVMKEWVAVVGRPHSWMPLAEEAYAFVAGLAT